MSQTLTAAYGAQAAKDSADTWLKLWQRPWAREVQQAGVDDLTAMWYMVLAGLSARLYRAASCPATINSEGVVTVPLDFYVFPSSLGLQYSLAAAIGTISAGIAVEEEREFDLIFDQQDVVDLGYQAAGIEYVFQSEAYDEMGRQIARPRVSYAEGRVHLSASCFCVLRIRCRALGYRHTVTMELTKFEPGEDADGAINYTGYTIENLRNSIQATWMENDELQSEKLDLEIPPCVEDYLALCEDDTLKGIIGHLGDVWTIVFYSTCTGNILGVRRSND